MQKKRGRPKGRKDSKKREQRVRRKKGDPPIEKADEKSDLQEVKATVTNDELVFVLNSRGEDEKTDENGNLVKKRGRKRGRKNCPKKSKEAKQTDKVPKKRGRKPKLHKMVKAVKIGKRLRMASIDKLLAQNAGLDDATKAFLVQRKQDLESKKRRLAERAKRTAAWKANSLERDRKRALIEEKRQYRIENGLPARGRIPSQGKKPPAPKPRYGRFAGRGPMIFDHG